MERPVSNRIAFIVDETDTRKPADVAAVTRTVTEVLGAENVRETNRKIVEAFACAVKRVTKTYRVEWYDPEGVRVENHRRFETRKEAVAFAQGVKATGQRDVCLVTVEEV